MVIGLEEEMFLEVQKQKLLLSLGPAQYYFCHILLVLTGHKASSYAWEEEKEKKEWQRIFSYLLIHIKKAVLLPPPPLHK